MTTPLTLDAFRADLAEQLHQDPREVDLAENPLDAGLDSLRLHTLAERWRAAGADVTFLDLAEGTSFEAWWRLVAPRGAGDGPARD